MMLLTAAYPIANAVALSRRGRIPGWGFGAVIVTQLIFVLDVVGAFALAFVRADRGDRGDRGGRTRPMSSAPGPGQNQHDRYRRG